MEHIKGASLAVRLEALIAPQVRALGYDLLELEYLSKSPIGGALVRLFIDHPGTDPLDPNAPKIGLEDCVKVDKGLDDFFESATFSAEFPTAFTLEVSSPGLDRPLKQLPDFEKFKTQRAQINTYRPVTAEEMGNPQYFKHHQKQKNFLGVLLGIEGDRIVLEADKERITIPYPLIAKAHLDIASTVAVDDE
jgi:ribosome maturation factor RimP